MHTFEGKKVTIHYNSDFSGEAVIFDGNHEVRVPCHDLLNFVANYVLSEKIARLESMGTRELLGLGKKGGQ